MHAAQIADIAVRHRVRLILQHGSTVTGCEHPRSDLDLAALFEPGLASRSAIAALADDLQAACPGQDVDLVVLNHADPLLLKRVLERCRLLHGDTRRLAELRMYAFKRYQDHRRFLALERRYVNRFLEGTAAP